MILLGYEKAQLFHLLITNSSKIKNIHNLVVDLLLTENFITIFISVNMNEY